MSDLPARPRQVTLAAALIMGGSAFIIGSVFERVAGLGSLETQKSVAEFLSEPPGDGLGLDAEEAVTALRVLSMIAGACATATAILGFHVLRRSRSSRLGLAVLALPLFVSGMAVGGFLSSVVVAATVMLWLQPSRDWFDGVTRRPAVDAARSMAQSRAETPAETTAEPPSVRADEPPVPPPSGEPRPMAGFGTAPVGYVASASTAQSPLATRPAPRPPRLLWACVLTWTFCGLAIIAMGLSVVVLLAAPDIVFDELHRQNPDLAAEGLSDSEIKSATFVSAAVVLVWGGAAILFAVQAFRGVPWGRLALLISASSAAAVCLVGSIVNLLLVLPLVACLVTVSLLVRSDVRAWFASRSSRP
ncbi:MAG: hypothetical protein Q8O61_18960 [Nocardioides sp.]|nr:hypothetical protein [Nocardioides sp.]